MCMYVYQMYPKHSIEYVSISYLSSYWIVGFQLDILFFWWIVTWTRVSKLIRDLLCLMFLNVVMVFAKVVRYHPFCINSLYWFADNETAIV